MARSLREPIPVGPFLWWCHRRVAEIERELDTIADDQGVHQDESPKRRLLFEIGWHGEYDMRRLYRWAHETRSGCVERGLVEDALHHAGADFYRVYWSVKPPKGKGGRLGLGRRMTDEQVIAAHTVYARGKLTVREVAELIYERHGHATPEAADVALRTAWRSLGLPLRACVAVNEKTGLPCGNAPRSGHDHCHTHLGCGWRVPDEMIYWARVLHGHGQPFRVIAMVLLSQTPYTSVTWLADQLATIATIEGWHRTQQFGQRRKHTRVRAYAQHEVAA